MKYIVLFIKKVVLALCMLYAVNLIISNVGISIPINYISIISVALLGFPALLGIVFIRKLL